ncbi:MAG: hypothetical protein A2Y40_01120 [Candidatus Margulisbacteria bacterium GWF2_35_9]|nr:MAG: hypothetical protein A2Y40_01120 [Candidatus Margulisbacteria bacterium GWF2_35_9]
MKYEDNQETNVCILGLGYVGLTLATIFADVGIKVTGIDRDEILINNLNVGKPPFFEKGLVEMLSANAHLPFPPTYLVGLKEPCATIYIITVGTPIMRPSLEPNLDYVRNATKEVAAVLRAGDLVILRSTVPIGVTRNVVLPALESISGLVAGKGFDLAFCPERTIEGKALTELRELPQIVGGYNKSSTERAANLFRNTTQTVIDVGSIEASEMLKILDNTYRDLMFAYSNQMALLCANLGLDMTPIVRAANQGYNRNRIPVPSPGVGGACLSKDPYILASVCRQAGIDPELFILGRQINEFMPLHAVQKVEVELEKLGKPLKDSTILVLGFAFKGQPETSDMRDSPTIDLVNYLKQKGSRVIAHDPLVSREEIKALGVEVTTIENGFAHADAVIIMLNHTVYQDLDMHYLIEKAKKPLVLMDGWHLYSKTDMDRLSGLVYRSI